MTDAIQNEDVSTEEELTVDTPETTEERELSPREKAMNEIARQNAEREGREYPTAKDADESIDAGDGEDTITAEADTVESEGEDTVSTEQPQAAPDPLEELGYYRKPDGKLYTKMKIRGEEREVRADQVMAYIQKDIAAEEGLQQVAEERRRLQEERAQLNREREEKLKQSLQPSTQDAEQIKEKAKSFIQKIYDGVEGAEDDLVAFMQSARTTIDPDVIVQTAKAEMKSEIERERQAEREQAWSRSAQDGNRALQESHPEIYKDAELFRLVNSKTAEMVNRQQQGDPDYINLAPADIIARAATEVQEWLDSRSQPKPSTTNTRQSRKDNLKPIPKTLGTVNQKPKKEELDMSPAAVIARQRAARATV